MLLLLSHNEVSYYINCSNIYLKKKIIIFQDDGKISLSMKLVDQGSGRDLDPNGVQML